ncbi:MAG: hypothetical protein ACKOUM_03770, partial [Sphingopyxis sp.]
MPSNGRAMKASRHALALAMATASAAASAAVPPPAMAQNDAGADASLSASANAGASASASADGAAQSATAGIGDIVVTATRRSESAQRVPIAINAIAGDALARRGILETSDLASQVPNLQVSS